MNMNDKGTLVDVVTNNDTSAAPGTEAKVVITDAEVIADMKLPFIPIDERVLIKPLDPIKLTKTSNVVDEDAMVKAERKAKKYKTDIPELITKEVTTEVESNLRIGVVLATGDIPNIEYNRQYGVGDKVVYVYKAAMPFDLFKDSVLLKRYEILGKWLKD